MKKMLIILLSLTLLFSSCSNQNLNKNKNSNKNLENLKIATFAGGCFWCTESDLEKNEGVVEVISGYSGGEKLNPTYKQVSSGTTNYTESIQIYYDPKIITYEKLLDIFFRSMDPTDSEGQFIDRGRQYRPAIFYNNIIEKKLIENKIKKLEENKIFDKKIVIEVVKFKKFYPAEEYHQDYYKKNPIRYKFYRLNSGRDQFLKKTWNNKNKKMKGNSNFSEKDLKNNLTKLQYDVTQNDATEKPFDNTYWDNKKNGIYVDIVSGEALFSSTDKYKSGTGWPSFTKPLEEKNIIEKEDNSLFSKRVEIRSSNANSHLGHLFTDGPKDRGGLRYCMNSAALKFIAKEDLKNEGYEKYLYLFE